MGGFLYIFSRPCGIFNFYLCITLFIILVRHLATLQSARNYGLYAKWEGDCTWIKHTFKEQYILATTLSSEYVAGLEASAGSIVIVIMAWALRLSYAYELSLMDIWCKNLLLLINVPSNINWVVCLGISKGYVEILYKMRKTFQEFFKFALIPTWGTVRMWQRCWATKAWRLPNRPACYIPWFERLRSADEYTYVYGIAFQHAPTSLIFNLSLSYIVPSCPTWKKVHVQVSFHRQKCWQVGKKNWVLRPLIISGVIERPNQGCKGLEEQRRPPQGRLINYLQEEINTCSKACTCGFGRANLRNDSYRSSESIAIVIA